MSVKVRTPRAKDSYKSTALLARVRCVPLTYLRMLTWLAQPLRFAAFSISIPRQEGLGAPCPIDRKPSKYKKIIVLGAEEGILNHPKFHKFLILGGIGSNTPSVQGFFAFRPFCPVEPIFRILWRWTRTRSVVLPSNYNVKHCSLTYTEMPHTAQAIVSKTATCQKRRNRDPQQWRRTVCLRPER
jgi:hypothetical protein